MKRKMSDSRIKQIKGLTQKNENNNLRNPEISEIIDSDNGGLPKDWKIVKLGDFVKTEKGKKPTRVSSTKTKEFSIPYVNIKAFEKNIIDEYTDGVGCAICENDDFLMVWDGSRSGYVGKAIKGALGSTLVKLKFPGMDQDYVYYFLQSKYIEINTRAKGVGIPHVDPNLLWNFAFPIPPLSEQHRIVAKLEELLSELEKGKEQLHTALDQLKVYRQAVLKYAFEGKLTRQNRGLNGFKDDTEKSESRIKRIKRLTRTEEKNNPRNPIICEIGDSDNELPKGWKWVKIKEIGRIETGTTPSKKNPNFYGSKFPFYKPTDLNAGNNVYKSLDGLSELGIKEARYVPEGSILVTCIGATIGKTGFVKNGGGFNQQINAIVPIREYLSKYIYYQAIGSHFQKQIKDNASATTLPILNKGKFGILEMVICPLEEQHRIVEEIESRLSVADKLEETITASLQQSETLRQSILKKAFEGGLV